MATCAACGAENPEGARFCNACATSFQTDADAAWRESRKTVTILFCDVTGSTALGERLDPEALNRVMSRYFEAMREPIERHGGTVEKFIGDAVMAVFGVPHIHEDDALRAVRAADDMRQTLMTLNKELERDHGASLQVRIGVNTGEVMVEDPAADSTSWSAIRSTSRPGWNSQHNRARSSSAKPRCDSSETQWMSRRWTHCQ